MARKRKETDPFERLTWNDLTAWAGTKIVSRGKNYQRNGYVKSLAYTTDGSLIAWVEGTERYATQVFYEDDELESNCTCPYWDKCKHAVAVVVEYLEKLKKQVKIPKATKTDRRLKLHPAWMWFFERCLNLHFHRPIRCCGQWIENWRISGRFMKASKFFGNRKKRRPTGTYWQTSLPNV